MFLFGTQEVRQCKELDIIVLYISKPRRLEVLAVDWVSGRHYKGADKSLARPGKKQTTATEDFEFFHISYL